MRWRFPVPFALVNGVLFNISWFLIVTAESGVWSPLLAALHLVIHFAMVASARGVLWPEVKLVAAVSLLGVALDTLLFRTGVFTVGGEPATAPLWMTSLWPVLATTFMHAFSALQSRPALAALFGATGGALSYSAGTSLTAVDFFDPLGGPLVLAALWTVLFPLLLALAGRLSRQELRP